jgi:hypothetical protein
MVLPIVRVRRNAGTVELLIVPLDDRKNAPEIAKDGLIGLGLKP